MDFDDYNDGFAADSVYTGTTTSSEQPAKEKKSDKSRRSRSRDRSPRGRGRRDRSRSHDRRDRRDDRRDRSRSRDRRRSRSRSRSRSRDRRRRPSRPADNLKQVTLKGLPRGCDANAIYPVLDTIAMYIGTVAKLEMVDSSSATIDMETEEGAKMLAMYGNLEIDGKPCTLEANFKTENVKQEARRSTDWVCVQCNTMNFARRQECFQCQASRLGNSIAVEDTVPHYDMGDRGGGSNQAARAPKEDTTLLVRDIPELASEQSVRNAFNPFGQLTEVRHLPERRLAFVEFESTSSLQQAMRQADERGIRVDGKYVTVTVARGRDNPPSGGDKSGAHAAIEQAMAMAQARSAAKGRRGREGGEERRGEDDAAVAQPQAQFKLDLQSGYYHNAETDQYYDQASGVYYTYKDGKTFYFDPTSQDYVACAAIGSTLPPGSGVLISQNAHSFVNN